jgi:hypothetical protein
MFVGQGRRNSLISLLCVRACWFLPANHNSLLCVRACWFLPANLLLLQKGMKGSDLAREIVHGAAVSWLSFPVDRVSKL